MNKRTIFLFIAILFHFTVKAQQDEQLWLDFQVSYPFANRYLLENTTTYQSLLSPKDKWRSFSISPTFEYTMFRRLDLLSELPLTFTTQKTGYNTFEVTPMVGARFYITPNKRIDTRLVWRYQTRFFKEVEADVWDISNRTRLRGEIFFSINGPNLYTDKLWYTFLDYEEFFVLDEQVDERFANKRRGRVGLGYRLNYKHRFELSYTLQKSRNEIEGDFISTDNVIQFRYKMYLNPSKPVSTDQ
jgi:hypothetical protein